jgi:hypothetical protein
MFVAHVEREDGIEGGERGEGEDDRVERFRSSRRIWAVQKEEGRKRRGLAWGDLVFMVRACMRQSRARVYGMKTCPRLGRR